LGVDGVDGSRCAGIAVGRFVFFADFALGFALLLDLEEDGVFAAFGCLLGVLVTLVATPLASSGVRDNGVADEAPAVSPRSLDGPASGVASWPW
jgi:hypothetical protein